MRVPLLVTLVCGVVCGVVCCTGCTVTGPRSLYDTSARSRLEVLAASQTNVQFLQSLDSLPASVRVRLAPIADAGRPFSKGCTGRDPHQRFLAATKAGGTYNVAIESGGIVYTWFIVQFVVDRAEKVIQEAQIEQDSAANGSQPIRSETNSTSSAAGPPLLSSLISLLARLA